MGFNKVVDTWYKVMQPFFVWNEITVGCSRVQKGIQPTLKNVHDLETLDEKDLQFIINIVALFWMD